MEIGTLHVSNVEDEQIKHTDERKDFWILEQMPCLNDTLGSENVEWDVLRCKLTVTNSKFKASTPLRIVDSTLRVRKPRSYIPLHQPSLALNYCHERRQLMVWTNYTWIQIRLKPEQPAHFRAQLEECPDGL